MLTATSGTTEVFGSERERERKKEKKVRRKNKLVFLLSLNRQQNKKHSTLTSEVCHGVQELDDLLPQQRGTRVDSVRGPADLRVAEAPFFLVF